MIKVLSVASECAPLVKTGGLADVVGALPAALVPAGVEMRVLLPGYPAVLAIIEDAEIAFREKDLLGGDARILKGTASGLDVYVIDAPHLFDRAGSIYLDTSGRDWPDNPERFAALSWIGARIGMGADPGWTPQIVHCHDWQAGFVPDYLATMKGTKPATILTVHNIAFHGLAPESLIPDLRLDPEKFDRDGFEFWGKVSALKAGLMAADKLTTVSPTYAEELMTEEFGMGLDGVMRYRRDDLSGILNGIDEDVWNPATDPLVKTYKTPRGKAAAKSALRKEFGLGDARGPLCVVVTRLTEQKGIDLLLDALPNLLARDGQLAVLGSGNPTFEEALKTAANHPSVAVRIGYDEALSHRMIAGGDAILVPSRFEPCGLTQLYGLRYGTIPLVAMTGGLADTVINASPAALAVGVATGIQFQPVTTDSLRGAFNRLCDLYAMPDQWQKMQRNAMKQPVGWTSSAAAYAQLYKELARPA
jgi:starch synthase